MRDLSHPACHRCSATAMASLLRGLVAGAPPETLRERAESILRQIDRCAPREPGENDEK
jgi:hypothetical protein